MAFWAPLDPLAAYHHVPLRKITSSDLWSPSKSYLVDTTRGGGRASGVLTNLISLILAGAWLKVIVPVRVTRLLLIGLPVGDVTEVSVVPPGAPVSVTFNCVPRL